MSDAPLITEDDWIRPLVLLRVIADEHGLVLSENEEQAICRQVVESVTAALAEEIEARVRALAETAEAA